ncbi:biotin-dependent carboxyltransferase family protein [uncultured Algibacter sp.]|uniref:5-oxoprolinase subunit C family protein n=1 Tax=uncultured Algibacter sp. TaxID=298659 RepID=UPI00260AB934|nr:biotin-dependent carboxyltransferase family protein [uncultured Algibacter sp.]
MIKVLKPGLFSTIQDLGRFGYQEFGVPYSGVMDRQAATVANALLGNHKNDAVIEMTMMGVSLEFKCETLICISGADMCPKLNGIPISNNKVLQVKPKDVLAFGRLLRGFRAYIAVLGGFRTEISMNSRSFYKGVTLKNQLIKGDCLRVKTFEGISTNKNALLKVNLDYLTINEIEVYKGAEFDLLSMAQQKRLFNSNFSISNINNRMAYQLNEAMENDLRAVITSPVLPGTVQLTPSGKLIVLMRDCQTTGGYPRILQLKESAINCLAQKYRGQTIAFKIT